MDKYITITADTNLRDVFNCTSDAVIVDSSFNVSLYKNWWADRRDKHKSINNIITWKITSTENWYSRTGKLFLQTLRTSCSKSQGSNIYFFTSCCTAYAPSCSLCTAIRCHWAGFGKCSAPSILWSYIPPVPTVKMVTVLPFLKIFCTGACPILPQMIAYI